MERLVLVVPAEPDAGGREAAAQVPAVAQRDPRHPELQVSAHLTTSTITRIVYRFCLLERSSTYNGES